MPRRKNAADNFLAFYLIVLKYERIYPTQQRAYVEAESEWLLTHKDRRFVAWDTYRGAVHRFFKDNHVDFYIGRAVKKDNGVDFVAIVSTNLNDVKFQMSILSSAIRSNTIIYRSSSGRIDETATEL